jgi:hypothetical protein
MIFRSFESLPKSKKNIFIVFEEHINKYKLDILLKENINNCIVISDKNPG